MNRLELVERLDRVAPALSANNLVPILSHFWFRDNTLLCYNDQIAISTKLTTEFEGAVPGSTLTALLSVSRAKEVDFFVGEADGKKLPEGQLLIKAASSKLKLPFMEVKSTEIFEMPKPDAPKALPVDMKAFLEAIDDCVSSSLREDTSMPDSLGITLVIGQEHVDLYSTNDATISYARVKIKKNPVVQDGRVVISGNFCRQMIALSKLSEKCHVEIHDDYSLFQCGDNILFGRLVDVQRPLDFDSVIESSFSAEAQNNLVNIPTKLQLILDRAVIITESKTERSKTAIVVKDGIARFHSQSEKGEVKDQMQLEPMQPDVSVSIDPRLFKIGYGRFSRMVFTPACLIMEKNGNLYLVSASA